MTMSSDLLTAARAEALFTSDLSTGSHPTSAEVAAAIRRAVRIHGGTRGCATELASEYGDHPDTAVSRMRWALAVVRAVYTRHADGVRWSAQRGWFGGAEPTCGSAHAR